MGPLNLILINLIFEVLGITAVSRKVKVELIVKINPCWEDLYDKLF